MKKMTILIFSLLFINFTFSQESVIKITNQTSKKEKIIKENKRIKIKTTDGRKISGRFTVIDNNAILIKNEQILLTNIEEIKRNSLAISIFTTGFLVYGGAVTAGLGVIIGAFADSTAFLLTIPAAGMIYTGIKSPNFQKNHKKDKSWTFEIIKNSE